MKTTYRLMLALICCGFSVLTLPLAAGELIENGDFTASKTDDWTVSIREGYGGDIKLIQEEKGVLRVKVSSASNHSYATVNQKVKLKAGTTYKVRVEVKSTGADKAMRISVNWNYPDHAYTNAGLQERVKLSSENWTVVETSFTATEPEAKKPYAVFNLLVGKLDHDLLVRKVSITE